MAVGVTAPSEQDRAEEVLDVRETSCCIVGGGPGGAMLALLLARQGLPVTLLEAHLTFERDFRGDSIHPGLLEILDEIEVRALKGQENGAPMGWPWQKMGSLTTDNCLAVTNAVE